MSSFMANNELSGPIVSMCLIDYFKKFKNLNKTLRFIFIPETIGSITYLSEFIKVKKKFNWRIQFIMYWRRKKLFLYVSKYKNTQADKALIKAYKELGIKFKGYSFLKRGSDERQYCSPFVELPIASILELNTESI